MIYAGIDCGTQGTKVVLLDTEQGAVIGEGYAPHDLLTSAEGKREQQPQWWIDALINAFRQAITEAGVDVQRIAGLSVAGQQHGLVALDSAGDVLCPAKLWCDTSTTAENTQYLSRLGGHTGSLEQLGLVVATGYTASKILWLKQQHPELWQRLAAVLLPHDYLNYWLTGQLVTEYGDASGSGLFDIRRRQWSRSAVEQIDDSGRLWQALPRLIAAHDISGTLTPQAASLLGIPPHIPVASGGGDNMLAAIGTGNIQPGIVTLSLGTSGTLFAYADQPITSSSGLIASFCSSSNGWLPLICTMNVTSTTSTVQRLLQQDLSAFEQALQNSTAGAAGLQMLPFFNGERVPDLPHAKASLHGLDNDNFTPANLCRAAVESATFGLRYGLDLFREAGIIPTEIRLTGGGANSALWRQIVADVMACQVISPREKEAAALGAAIQAAWCAELQRAPGNEEARQQQLQALCERFVQRDPATLARPDPASSEQYQALYSRYLTLLQQQYPQVVP